MIFETIFIKASEYKFVSYVPREYVKFDKFKVYFILFKIEDIYKHINQLYFGGYWSYMVGCISG